MSAALTLRPEDVALVRAILARWGPAACTREHLVADLAEALARARAEGARMG